MTKSGRSGGRVPRWGRGGPGTETSGWENEALRAGPTPPSLSWARSWANAKGQRRRLRLFPHGMASSHALCNCWQSARDWSLTASGTHSPWQSPMIWVLCISSQIVMSI